ncbi:MAG: hypothetical protein ACI8XB_001557 [Patiriisocius sp.]|jgi:hypothetical protein
MRLLVLFVFTLQSVLFIAQSDINTIVKDDLIEGKIDQLSKYFTDNIDISIEDADAIYSRSQAAMILKKFFTDNKVIKFQTEHSSNSDDNNQYIIGKMETEKGQFRVTYFITKDSDGLKIKQFNIESY